jgi:hypothetical protein
LLSNRQLADHLKCHSSGYWVKRVHVLGLMPIDKEEERSSNSNPTSQEWIHLLTMYEWGNAASRLCSPTGRADIAYVYSSIHADHMRKQDLLLRRIDDRENILSRTIDQDEELTAWKKDCEMDEKHQEHFLVRDPFSTVASKRLSQAGFDDRHPRWDWLIILNFTHVISHLLCSDRRREDALQCNA